MYALSLWSVDLELVQDWMRAVDQNSYEQVVAASELLERQGPQLGRPVVDSIRASRHHNMKEIRPGSSGRTELRILFAFDPRREAILLVAGDTSDDWTNWYRTNIAVADRRFDEHLNKLEGK